VTPEEQRAYSRGYNAGRRNAWPDHLPPAPPDPVIRRLMAAMKMLRDDVDHMLATGILDESDPVSLKLGAAVDECDAAAAAVTEWLKSGEG
jgi:hypothetical protein